MEIERRAVGPNDVLLDILYCGICHSDIHQVRDEWNAWGPTVYPCVPGHEIIGRGITTFSPMQLWRLTPGQHVGVIGLGAFGAHAAIEAWRRKRALELTQERRPDLINSRS